jgi:hypothetical protein
MQLSVGNTTGAIFALKNMGWIDQISTDLTTLGKEIKQAPSIVFKTFKNDE